MSNACTTIPATCKVRFLLEVSPVSGFLASQVRTSEDTMLLKITSSSLSCDVFPSRVQVYKQGGLHSAEHLKPYGMPMVTTCTPTISRYRGPSVHKKTHTWCKHTLCNLCLSTDWVIHKTESLRHKLTYLWIDSKCPYFGKVNNMYKHRSVTAHCLSGLTWCAGLWGPVLQRLTGSSSCNTSHSLPPLPKATTSKLKDG